MCPSGRTTTNRLGGLRMLLAMAAIVAFPVLSSGGEARDVDLALVLAIDCSDSVDDTEFRQQLDGIARAFRHQAIIDAIKDGPTGRVAVTAIEWSNPQSPTVVVKWMVVDGASSAESFARQIERAKRLVIGGTSISAAIDASTALLLSAPYRAGRLVADISSDGINNTGDRPEVARDRAISLGVVINGLTILNEVPYLALYFKNRVIGGSGSFVVDAADYLAYEKAILQKLLREIVRPMS